MEVLKALFALGILIGLCTAISLPSDVGMLKRQIQKRHPEWTDNCVTAHCWIFLWDRIYDSDNDIDRCREKAIPVFKSCLQRIMDSSDICTCGYLQLRRDLDILNDDLICEKQIRPPAYYGYTSCDDPQAEACRVKTEAFWGMTKQSPLPSVSERRSALSEAEQCTAGVIADSVSTVGCTNAFTGPGDMEATRSAVAAYVFAQGCDDVVGILSNCAPPEEVPVSGCNGQYYDIAGFLECARGAVSGQCRDMVNAAEHILTQAKDAACTRLEQVKSKVDASCGEGRRKRNMLKRLLQLLGDK